MTDERLHGIAAQMANIAKTEMRNKGKFTAILAVCNEGQPLFRMKKLERTICELAGEQWLNDGAAKGAAFSIMREALTIKPQDGIGICTLVDDFQQTAAFDRLPPEEQHRAATEGNIWEHVKAGLFEPHDALLSTIQTPERVCLFKQRLQGSLLIGQPDVHFLDQADFGGRMKMFGLDTSARTGTE